jgi:hypothetical protein
MTGLPASCLSPCHGFFGIVEQWKTSTHYAAFISNIGNDEVSSWTGPTACGNCHAQDAIELRVANDIATQGGGAVTNAKNGQLNYRNPTNAALSEATYTGMSKVAQVGCVTCHSVTPASDPHRTGLPYAPGTFPLRVPSGANDGARIEKSPDTTAITGTVAGVGVSNTCIWCHRSRKDVTNYIGMDTALTKTSWGPHHGPQADVYSGAGGYHYAGLIVGNVDPPTEARVRRLPHTPWRTMASRRTTRFTLRSPRAPLCHQGDGTSISTAVDRNPGIALRGCESAERRWVPYRSEEAPYLALSSSELDDGNSRSTTRAPAAPPCGTLHPDGGSGRRSTTTLHRGA